jgi:hypothetical protein
MSTAFAAQFVTGIDANFPISTTIPTGDRRHIADNFRVADYREVTKRRLGV